MTLRTARSLALAVVILAFTVPAFAHKFHASLAEVEYNASMQRVEIALRLFTDDLEEAVGRMRGRRVRLGVTPDAERYVLAYVQSALELDDEAGAPLRLEWVGMEVRADEVWVYVKAASERGLSGMRLADHMFVELFDDQVNRVSVKEGNRKATLVFEGRNDAATITFE